MKKTISSPSWHGCWTNLSLIIIIICFQLISCLQTYWIFRFFRTIYTKTLTEKILEYLSIVRYNRILKGYFLSKSPIFKFFYFFSIPKVIKIKPEKMKLLRNPIKQLLASMDFSRSLNCISYKLCIVHFLLPYFKKP